jgi:hypothetical protein
MNFFVRLVAQGSLPFAVLVAGCSGQTEGERCTTTSDCQTNLICFQVGATYGICCSTPSSLAVCNPGINNDAGVTPGTDAGEEAAADTSTGTTEDGSADGGTE